MAATLTLRGTVLQNIVHLKIYTSNQIDNKISSKFLYEFLTTNVFLKIKIFLLKISIKFYSKFCLRPDLIRKFVGNNVFLFVTLHLKRLKLKVYTVEKLDSISFYR